MKKIVLLLILAAFVIQGELLANKTSVKVNTPSEAKKSTEVTLIINVTHKGNSKLHFTDWVSLKINGVEVKKWQYDKNNLPVSENFTLEYKFTVNEDVTIEAVGNCNLHGSAGSYKTTIKAL